MSFLIRYILVLNLLKFFDNAFGERVFLTFLRGTRRVNYKIRTAAQFTEIDQIQKLTQISQSSQTNKTMVRHLLASITNLVGERRPLFRTVA